MSEDEIIDFVNNKKFDIGTSTENEGTGDVFKVPVVGYMFICFDQTDQCYRVEPVLHPSFDFHNQVGYGLCSDEKLINVFPAIRGDYAIIGCIPDDGVTYSGVMSGNYGIHTEILCHVVPGIPAYDWKTELKRKWSHVLIESSRT